MFDNRAFARWPALNTLLPRVVYGAPVPTAAHATSIACTSYGVLRSKAEGAGEAISSQSCERCGRGRADSAGSAATASTASRSLSDASGGAEV